MSGLRIPWAQYTLPFSLSLLFMAVMGSRPVISPTYTLFTMANYENLKLTGTLRNTPQKIHPPNFPGFDTDTALKTHLTTHLSTPSSHLPPLLPISQPTPPPTSTSIFSSNITTLELYISPKSKIIHQHSNLASSSSITQTVPFSSHARPRPSTTTNHLSLSSLFGPCRWNKYFHIPAHAPCSKNTFQFQKCIQRQVGVTFHTRSDRSCLVIVDSESEAEAMFTLKDLDGEPFPVSPDTQLNTRTGTILIPNEICPDSISWSDCFPDLFELIADDHDIAHVSCFTINPRGRPKYSVNIARIAFKGQNLPDRVYLGGAFYKVKPYIPHPRQCQNCWRFGHPAKYCRSTAHYPLCALPGYTCINCPSTIRICANCTQEHNVFF